MNSADRVIRVFDIDVIMASYEDEEPEALQRLQDLVNRSFNFSSPPPSSSSYLSSYSSTDHSGRSVHFQETGSSL